MDFVNKLIALDEPVSWEEDQAQRRQNQQEAQTMFDNRRRINQYRRLNQVREQQVRDDREQRNWDIWNRTQAKLKELEWARNKVTRWARKRMAERRRNKRNEVLEGAQVLNNLSHGRHRLDALSEFGKLGEQVQVVPGEVVRVPRVRGLPARAVLPVKGAPFRGVFY